MKNSIVINKIKVQNELLKKELKFEKILTDNKKDLIMKVVDVWVEKYKYIFKKNDTEIYYEKYVEYLRVLSDFIIENFLNKKELDKKDLLSFHKLIFSILPKDNTDRLKSWQLRNEFRFVTDANQNTNLQYLDVFIDYKKVEKEFIIELNNFNTFVNYKELDAITHFFQQNISKIHPFYNWNGRFFFILLDVLLIKYDYLPLFIRQDKQKYIEITRKYMINKNFEELRTCFFQLILEKYKQYHIK